MYCTYFMYISFHIGTYFAPIIRLKVCVMRSHNKKKIQACVSSFCSNFINFLSAVKTFQNEHTNNMHIHTHYYKVFYCFFLQQRSPSELCITICPPNTIWTWNLDCGSGSIQFVRLRT